MPAFVFFFRMWDIKEENINNLWNSIVEIKNKPGLQ